MTRYRQNKCGNIINLDDNVQKWLPTFCSSCKMDDLVIFAMPQKYCSGFLDDVDVNDYGFPMINVVLW